MGGDAMSAESTAEGIRGAIRLIENDPATIGGCGAIAVLRRCLEDLAAAQADAVRDALDEKEAIAATIPAEILDLATQAVAEALGDSAFDCTRVWEAWSYGTMGPNDFTEVHERADEIAAAALAAAYPAIAAAERSRIRQAVFARAMLWRDQIIAATTSAEVLAASHMYQAAHHILDREIDPVQ